MVFDVLRGYLHVASGLSDVTKQRARDLAEMIVVQGMDVTNKSQEQVQTLTDELVESSRTNRELLIGLIRTEVDRTVSRMGFVREDELAAVRQHVNRLEVQLQKEHQRAAEKATEVVMGTAETSTAAARSAVGAASKTVSGVAGAMASGAAKMAGSASSAVSPTDAGGAAPEDSAPTSPTSDSAAQDTDVAPGKSHRPDQAAAGKQEAREASGKPPVKRKTKGQAAAKKAPAKKAPAKKSPVKKSPAKKSSSSKAGAAKQSTPKNAAARKAAPKKSVPKKAAAKKAAPKKTTGAKTPKKAAAKKPEQPKPKATDAAPGDSAKAGAPSSKESVGVSGKDDS